MACFLVYVFVFLYLLFLFFFFSSRRRHTRLTCDWSSDVCSSDLESLNCSLNSASRPYGAARHRRHQTGSVSCGSAGEHALPGAREALQLVLRERSEERRVGKECRSRWWPDH